jgi:hypothetical protein
MVNWASGYFERSSGMISWPMKPEAPVIRIFMMVVRRGLRWFD